MACVPQKVPDGSGEEFRYAEVSRPRARSGPAARPSGGETRDAYGASVTSTLGQFFRPLTPRASSQEQPCGKLDLPSMGIKKGMRMFAKIVFRLPVALLILCNVFVSNAAAQTPTGESDRKSVIVELFTSEGCSTCPPADEH